MSQSAGSPKHYTSTISRRMKLSPKEVGVVATALSNYFRRVRPELRHSKQIQHAVHVKVLLAFLKLYPSTCSWSQCSQSQDGLTPSLSSDEITDTSVVPTSSIWAMIHKLVQHNALEYKYLVSDTFLCVCAQRMCVCLRRLDAPVSKHIQWRWITLPVIILKK